MLVLLPTGPPALTDQWASEPGSAQANRPKTGWTRKGLVTSCSGQTDGNGVGFFVPSINTRIPSSQHKAQGEANLEQRGHGEAGGEEDEGREQEALGLTPAHHPRIQREHPPPISSPLPSVAYRAGQIRASLLRPV